MTAGRVAGSKYLYTNMKRSLLILLAVFLLSACRQRQPQTASTEMAPIHLLFQNYYEERMKLFPLEATSNGDNRYNDRLPIDISASYRDTLRNFYRQFLDSLAAYDRASLDETDRTSYDILTWDLRTALDGLQFHDELMPVNQFWSLPLTFGQLGSGKGSQPFKSAGDYDNFLGRVHGFAAWCDTAIGTMRRGMAAGLVNPRILMGRVLPQLKSMLVEDATQSIFYQPVKNMPKGIGVEDAARIDSLYRLAIRNEIIPAYRRLHDFIRSEYLPHCRETDGIGVLPGGKEHYQYLIRYWTTTDMTADEIFNVGQQEVARLRAEMERVKVETGFNGSLKDFFKFLNTDKRFFPFHSEKEVLHAFEDIHRRMEPQLRQLFDAVPRTPFEIRQTEKFREASASAEYNQGTPDGSRPGIFYVPIPDPRKFNTFGMEDLFLHEAIPGHHYQISLQQENAALPFFRRFTWYGAYGEGWALYAESLGKELGLYQDVYQYFGALSEEMHRAIRLVVDVGIHVKGWTREQAIQYSLENEGESREAITSEIERYMAIPGQALAYKIGQLKILELRRMAEQELGAGFHLPIFHDIVLESGCLPLAVLESRVKAWVSRIKNQQASRS